MKVSQTLKCSFSFKGRYTRRQYLTTFASMIVLYTFMILPFIYEVFKARSENVSAGNFDYLSSLGTSFLAAFLLLFWVSTAAFVKRLHDLGKSGVNILWLVVPLIGLLYFIYIIAKRGQTEPNDYGSVEFYPRLAMNNLVLGALAIGISGAIFFTFVFDSCDLKSDLPTIENAQSSENALGDMNDLKNWIAVVLPKVIGGSYKDIAQTWDEKAKYFTRQGWCRYNHNFKPEMFIEKQMGLFSAVDVNSISLQAEKNVKGWIARVPSLITYNFQQQKTEKTQSENFQIEIKQIMIDGRIYLAISKIEVE